MGSLSMASKSAGQDADHLACALQVPSSSSISKSGDGFFELPEAKAASLPLQAAGARQVSSCPEC